MGAIALWRCDALWRRWECRGVGLHGSVRGAEYFRGLRCEVCGYSVQGLSLGKVYWRVDIGCSWGAQGGEVGTVGFRRKCILGWCSVWNYQRTWHISQTSWKQNLPIPFLPFPCSSFLLSKLFLSFPKLVHNFSQCSFFFSTVFSLFLSSIFFFYVLFPFPKTVLP